MKFPSNDLRVAGATSLRRRHASLPTGFFPSPAIALTMLARVAALAGIAGCSLAPEGTKQELARLQEAGRSFETPIEQRQVPELPESPTWREVLRRAFLVNGDLEASYFRWKAAAQRIDAASAWPNTNAALGFDYMFSGERMKSFDRATISAGFDSSATLMFPSKVEQAGRVALDEARVAGEQFRVAKFELQRKVLTMWADYVLRSRKLALREEDLRLRRVMLDAAWASAGAGTRPRDGQAAQIDLQVSENELLRLRSEQDAGRAALNSLLGRDTNAVLLASGSEPEARGLPADDAVMLKAAADVFPEVAVMAREVEGRADALELARLQWIPDVSPTASFTGTISQAIGAMIMLPTNAASIRAGIEEARANLRASQASLRQRASDRVGEYVSLLITYRNAQRERAFLEHALLPAATALSQTDATAYAAGAGSLAAMIDSRRSLLAIREMIAESNALMDKAVVEIECCLGTDIEVISPDRAMNAALAGPSGAVPPAGLPGSQEAEHVH